MRMNGLLGVMVGALLCVGGCSRSEGDFAVKLVEIPGYDYFGSIKYNRKTGESWWMDGREWSAFDESEVIPESEYVIEMTNYGTEGNWAAVRIDIHSGASWLAVGWSWVRLGEKVNEPAPSSLAIVDEPR